MAQAFGILAIAGLILAVELPSLRKKQLKRELWAFSVLLFLATILNMVEAFQIELPNPMTLIGTLVQPITNLMKLMFH